jgi:hypothetical protein
MNNDCNHFNFSQYSPAITFLHMKDFLQFFIPYNIFLSTINQFYIFLLKLHINSIKFGIFCDKVRMLYFRTGIMTVYNV